MKTLIGSIVIALIALPGALVTEAHAAAYLKLGDIKGEATDDGHKEWIIIQSFGQGIDQERDAASGLPTGKRQHKPLTITKEVDKSSPLLMQSLTTGTPIRAARIEFVRTGEQDRYYRVFLKNLIVTSYESVENPGQAQTETFSLNYEEIKWTYSVWDDTDIVHVDHSYRWNLIHEAGEADKLPAGSFRLGMIGASTGAGGNILMAEWEGFEEFRYLIKTSPTVDGVYQTLMTHVPTEDGRQELELPIGVANEFIKIEKIRESILQQ